MSEIAIRQSQAKQPFAQVWLPVAFQTLRDLFLARLPTFEFNLARNQPRRYWLSDFLVRRVLAHRCTSQRIWFTRFKQGRKPIDLRGSSGRITSTLERSEFSGGTESRIAAGRANRPGSECLRPHGRTQEELTPNSAGSSRNRSSRTRLPEMQATSTHPRQAKNLQARSGAAVRAAPVRFYSIVIVAV